MNKHNIIELFDHKENKHKVKHEHQCFEFLDGLKDRIKMSKLYITNFKEYLANMVRDKNIKQEFADNLNKQVDMIVKAASEDFSKKEVK